MAQQKYAQAEPHFEKALKQAPNDYARLVMMAKCQLAQEKYDSASRDTDKAKAVFPEETQAHHLSGYVKIQQKKYAAAYEDFCAYEKQLPGNPSTIFFKGLSWEGMEAKEKAAQEYSRVE